jgi:hypothetical protein
LRSSRKKRNDDACISDDFAWIEILEWINAGDLEQAKTAFLKRCAESAIEAIADARR